MPSQPSNSMRHGLDRRDFLKGLGLAAGGLSFGGLGLNRLMAANPGGGAAGRPNILLVISDQLNAFTMGVSGCKEISTPTFDRMAAEGCRFEQAYTTYPLCVPWRSSMASGMYPHQFGLHGNNGGGRSPDDRKAFADASNGKTIFNLIRDAGYACHFSGKWHMTMDKKNSDFSGVHYHHRGGRINQIREAQGIIQNQKGTDPWFVTLSLDTPHEICGWARNHTKKGHPKAPSPEKCPPLPPNFADPAWMPEVLQELRARYDIAYPTEGWNEGDWRQYIEAYYRFTEDMDRYLGMMFETLRETGQDKNTVVVFVADHGDGCAAHHWNQKIALWEECTRVPLMIWQPGAIEGGRVVNDPVSTGLDLLPTLCDFAGASLPREYQGSSLKPVCMGDTQRPHDFVVTETDVRSGRGFSICSGRYKYVLYTSGANNELLFDLQEDPGETANRIDDSSLQNELKEHRAALGNWAVETKDELTVPST